MNNSDIFFDDLYQKKGVSVESLGWSEHGQHIRFELFHSLASLENKSILDVGCGFGDFYGHIAPHYKNMTYKGYDKSVSFVEEGKKKYGCDLEVFDILSSKIEGKYDMVYSIGMLNIDIGNNMEVMKKAMKDMYDACNEFVAISMTSTHVDKAYMTDNMFYYDPGELLNYARREISRKVYIRHDYLPHDFTIVLVKE